MKDYLVEIRFEGVVIVRVSAFSPEQASAYAERRDVLPTEWKVVEHRVKPDSDPVWTTDEFKEKGSDD